MLPIDLMESSDDDSSDDEIEVLYQSVSAKPKRDNEEVQFVRTTRNVILSYGPNRQRKAPNTASSPCPANVSTTTQSYSDIASAKAALQAKRCSEKKMDNNSRGSDSAKRAFLQSRKRALPFTSPQSGPDGSHERPIKVDLSLTELRNPQQKDNSPGEEERKPAAVRNLGSKQPKELCRKSNFGPQRALCTGLFAEYPIVVYDSSSDSDDTDTSFQKTRPAGWTENDDHFRKVLAQNLARKNESSTPPRQITQTSTGLMSSSPDPKSVRRLLAQRSPAGAKHRGIVPDNRSRSTLHASKIAAARPFNLHPFPKLGRSARALAKWPPFVESTGEMGKATDNEIPTISDKEAPSAQLDVPVPAEAERRPDSAADNLSNIGEHLGLPAKDLDADLMGEANDAEMLCSVDALHKSAAVVEPSVVTSSASEGMAVFLASKSSIEAPDRMVQENTMVDQHSLSADGVALGMVDAREVTDSSVSVAIVHDKCVSVSDEPVESPAAIVFPDDHIPPSASKQMENVAIVEAEEEELPPWINMIEHLSFKTTDPETGLPVHDFSIHGGDDCKHLEAVNI